jgi:hypothetical protein
MTKTSDTDSSLAIAEISRIREVITGGQSHDLKGFGEFAAAEITRLRSEVERLREVLSDCARAADFYGRVVASPKDERISVGTNYLDWVLRACQNASRYLGPSLDETDEHAERLDCWT